MADPVNQATIRRYCETWPRMRLVLAHSGTAFNPHHTAEGIHSLAGLENVWFDTSAMTEAGAFEPIVRQFGHTRLMWGSDYPISHLRGRCVAIGDNHIWLYENNVDWDTLSYRRIQPVYLGLESLRAPQDGGLEPAPLRLPGRRRFLDQRAKAVAAGVTGQAGRLTATCPGSAPATA